MPRVKRRKGTCTGTQKIARHHHALNSRGEIRAEGVPVFTPDIAESSYPGRQRTPSPWEYSFQLMALTRLPISA